MTIHIYCSIYKYQICKNNILDAFNTWLQDDMKVMLLQKEYLIAYIDFAEEAKVLGGILTIKWSDKGIISKEILTEQEAYGCHTYGKNR